MPGLLPQGKANLQFQKKILSRYWDNCL